MFDEKVRSFLKFFWLLPLIAAPGLILLGYYEAHQEHLVTVFGTSKDSHSRGIYHTESLDFKEGHLGNLNAVINREYETRETLKVDSRKEKNEERIVRDGDKHEEGEAIKRDLDDSLKDDVSHREAALRLEEKQEQLMKKIRQQKIIIAKLKEEGKQLSAKVDLQICLTKKFAPTGSRPIVALSSAPGSGNTWARHLLESASGIYTGSIYNDKKLYRAGFYGEYEDYVAGTILVVKMHRFKAENSQKFDTAIVLVRNPYKAMVSEYNRILTGRNHTAVADPLDFSGEEWRFFVRQMGEKWLGIIEKWLAQNPNIHIVYYEELVKDTRTELGKMLEFLNVDIDPARMDCTIANQEGSFHRKSSNDFDPFTDELKTFLNGKITRAQDILTAYKKPPLPEEYFAKDFR